MGTPDPPVWEEYRRILSLREPEHQGIATVERYEFYERAKRAYAVVATGETAMRGNILLKKGVC